MKRFIFILSICSILSGCSSWIYKYDIQQGNYLNQDDVDKLRINMTKEQVEYVLGTTLLKSPFSSDSWKYIHTVKSGKTDETSYREVIVNFVDGRLTTVEGTLKPHVNFNEPLDE